MADVDAKTRAIIRPIARPMAVVCTSEGSQSAYTCLQVLAPELPPNIFSPIIIFEASPLPNQTTKQSRNMCNSNRSPCYSCGRRSACHARSCATRKPCFSCGRRGSCHRRSCATRQPGYNLTATQQRQRENGPPAYGFDAGELDAPPAYDGIASSKPETGKENAGGFIGFMSSKFWAGKEEKGDAKALNDAFEAGRIAGKAEKV
ncbi:MAG: hypothetical protein Q9164_000181 [Protoblastenia rupestris]